MDDPRITSLIETGEPQHGFGISLGLRPRATVTLIVEIEAVGDLDEAAEDLAAEVAQMDGVLRARVVDVDG